MDLSTIFIIFFHILHDRFINKSGKLPSKTRLRCDYQIINKWIKDLLYAISWVYVLIRTYKYESN